MTVPPAGPIAPAEAEVTRPIELESAAFESIVPPWPPKPVANACAVPAAPTFPLPDEIDPGRPVAATAVTFTAKLPDVLPLAVAVAFPPAPPLAPLAPAPPLPPLAVALLVTEPTLSVALVAAVPEPPLAPLPPSEF